MRHVAPADPRSISSHKAVTRVAICTILLFYTVPQATTVPRIS